MQILLCTTEIVLCWKDNHFSKKRICICKRRKGTQRKKI